MPIRPQHPNDIHIVVARYNEDIQHFARFNPHLFVYNKGNNDIHPNIDGYKLMAKELAEFITETYGLTTTKNPV